MSWNEIKVGVAPIGSKVYQSRDRSTTGTDGYPVTVLTVCPPNQLGDKFVKARDVEGWLAARGFLTITQKPQSSRFHFEDIEVLVVRNGDLLQENMLNFQVGPDARIRLGIWGRFVTEMCEANHLQLVDPEIGLVDSNAFEELAKRSFAWQCFLEQEKSS